MIMKTAAENFLTPVVQQITNNTTSWIGHRSGVNENVVTGQTFVAPSGGDLEAIEVFSSIVTKPGKVIMTLHSFDPTIQKLGTGIEHFKCEHQQHRSWQMACI